MRYKFFHIPVTDSAQAETALNDFCRQQQVISVDRELIADGQNTFWAVCVCWSESIASVTAQSNTKGRIDYKTVLSPADFSIFSNLRDLRKRLADTEGTPVCNVFTNEQLAEMVKNKVTTIADLSQIAGVGSARVEKYGDVFLQYLATETSVSISKNGD